MVNTPTLKPGNLSNSQRRLRGLSLLIGLAILCWLPFEDSSEIWAVSFAAFVLLLATTALILRYLGVSGMAWWLLPLSGLAAGLALTPLAILLMAIKTGIHSHSVPDFTPEQMLRVLRAAPIWTISGLVMGAGIVILIHRAKSSKPDSKVNRND